LNGPERQIRRFRPETDPFFAFAQCQHPLPAFFDEGGKEQERGPTSRSKTSESKAHFLLPICRKTALPVPSAPIARNVKVQIAALAPR